MTDRFFRYVRLLGVFFLSAALLCSFCGCAFFYNEEEISEILGATDPISDEGSENKTEAVFFLAYYTEEDLDPYTSSSRTNSELLRLCYSGLYATDETYTPCPVMVEGYEAEGNSVLIRLKDGLRFSDGSPVTAEDCVASYDRASAKESVWRHCFSYIRSYEAVDAKTFKVVFTSFYPSQLNLLTIPVVKASVADLAGYPVGCGRYRLSTANGLDLERVDCGIFDGQYDVERISLLGIADREALIYNFNYGRIQAVCAEPALGTEEYRSNNELVSIPSNRMSFLVVNRTRPALADVNFSTGITYLLDRVSLASRACGAFATPVWYPLNPAWSVTQKATLNPDIRSASAAMEAFDAAGLVLDGDVRMYGKEPVTLRLLVNRENASRVRAAEAVAEALRSVGFSTEVVLATWDEYRIAVETLDFDLYLGEVNFSSNMDFSSIYSLDVCNTGVEDPRSAELKASAEGVLQGTVDVRTYVSAFQEVLPMIPLYYSLDALAVSMDVEGEFGGSVSELYWGIENWVFSKSDE